MSDDENYSRRRLLQAVAVTGTLGAVGGSATGAYLSDRERFSGNRIETGELELGLATAQADDVESLPSFSADDFRTDGTVEVGLPEAEPGETGVLRIAHRLGEYRGRPWMRATSSSESDLGEYIDASLTLRPECDDETNPQFEGGTLSDLIDAYAGGKPIGDDCVEGRSCLDLEWKLLEDVPAELSEESLSCSFDFTAVQCRHTETDDNPWNETA